VRRIFNLTNALFLAALVLELVPSRREGVNAWYYIGLVLVLEVFYILNVLIKKDDEKLYGRFLQQKRIWQTGIFSPHLLLFLNIGTSGIFERNFELFSAAVRLGYWLEEKALQGCKSTYKSLGTDTSVFNVDKRIIDSAKALSVNEGSMLFQVILPATLPSIISGATGRLPFSDFADYSRVIAFLFDKIERYLLRWRK